MDSLAHSLVGLAIAKSGIEKLSPAATAVCIVAANAPDADFVSVFFGDRWTLLHYHRGITHSIVGTIALAIIIPSIFYVADLLLSLLRAQPRRLRLGGLMLASLIASATHPLMDWTNNYGIRLLLPWSAKWFYGDLVFIVDPLIWLTVGAAVFLVTSNTRLQLVLWLVLGAVVSALVAYAAMIRGALSHPRLVLGVWIAALLALSASRTLRVGQRWGGRIPTAALMLLVFYWSGLAFLHGRAVRKANAAAGALTRARGEEVTRLAVMPTLADPCHWQGVAETEAAAYRFDLYLGQGDNLAENIVRYAKLDPASAELIKRATDDRRARILLEFARFPVERIADSDCLTQTLVQIADLRYTEPGRSRGAFSLEIPIECPSQR